MNDEILRNHLRLDIPGYSMLFGGLPYMRASIAFARCCVPFCFLPSVVVSLLNDFQLFFVDMVESRLLDQVDCNESFAFTA